MLYVSIAGSFSLLYSISLGEHATTGLSPLLLLDFELFPVGVIESPAVTCIPVSSCDLTCEYIVFH